MIVPIDAWNKMLSQLGNLHEAGQQLAEARERAAKAETEAVFLRERLSELRAEAARSDAATTSDVSSKASNDPSDGGEIVVKDAAPKEASESTTYWRYVTQGWRDRRRR